jgi:hypothetical protein
MYFDNLNIHQTVDTECKGLFDYYTDMTAKAFEDAIYKQSLEKVLEKEFKGLTLKQVQKAAKELYPEKFI